MWCQDPGVVREPKAHLRTVINRMSRGTWLREDPRVTEVDTFSPCSGSVDLEKRRGSGKALLQRQIIGKGRVCPCTRLTSSRSTAKDLLLGRKDGREPPWVSGGFPRKGCHTAPTVVTTDPPTTRRTPPH